MKPRQRGGFVIGLVVGLLIGLALSLGVALYITKVPVPFVNKVPQRTPEQDAAEIEKNRNWDPNTPLYGKNPAKPSSTPATSPTPAVAAPPVATTPPPATPPAAAATPNTTASTATRREVPLDTRDPAAILGDKPAAAASAAPVVATARPSADPFSYFVQAGAYGRTEEAEQQRAKLGMLGLAAKVTEREQSGRTVYRVRLGPYDRKEDADAAKEKLDASSIEAALVRVQK